MEERRGPFMLTDDASRMDVPAIHRWLAEEAYWSLGRSLDEVEASMRQSLVVGLFADGKQVGFGRVITDGVTFAYLCDVFVEPGSRSQGLGTWMVTRMVAMLRESNIKQVLLATRDAHQLYIRAGFHTLTRPERWLEIDPTKNSAVL